MRGGGKAAVRASTCVEGGRQLCATVQALMPAIALASGDVALQAAGAREGSQRACLAAAYAFGRQRARAVEGPPAVGYDTETNLEDKLFDSLLRDFPPRRRA